MIGRLYKRMLGGNKNRVVHEKPPTEIRIGELSPLPFADYILHKNGFPIANWDAIIDWIKKIKTPQQQEEAWNACERGWFLYFRQSLGARYFLTETDETRLISPLPVREAQSSMSYIEHITHRISEALEGIALNPPDKELVIIFDHEKSYYRYVSLFYPKDSKYRPSDARSIQNGCLHFVIRQKNLALLEHFLVRKLTRLYLSHLQIPFWLQQGLMAYTEQQLGLRAAPDSKLQLLNQQAQFWDKNKIQRFWSGNAFKRAKSSLPLVEDLAHRMVILLAKRWDRFKEFATTAAPEDAGTLAASDSLGIDLGEFISTMIFEEPYSNWAPDPERWPLKNASESSRIVA